MSGLRMFVRDEIFETVEVWLGERLVALLLIEGDSLDILNFTVHISRVPMFGGECTRDRSGPRTVYGDGLQQKRITYTDIRLTFTKNWFHEGVKIEKEI